MANDDKSNQNNLPSNDVIDSVLGSPDDFFAALDQEFNGAMQEQPAETIVETSTPQPTGNSEFTDPNGQADSDTDWKKRYGDSTRENQELLNLKKEVEPVMPIINAMKEDPKLVETVQNYLQNGGETPKSINEQLGLDEHFLFDMNDAMSDPTSDSAKVMNTMIEKTVEQRVNNAVNQEKEKVTENRKQQALEKERQEFVTRHNMSEAEFEDFNNRLNSHVLTFEDMYLILNKDKATQNMAQNTRNAYAQQVDSVRKMPVSAGGTNSSGSSVKSDEDALFDALIGDSGTDNLFG